jgi:hypothetical protein
MKKNLAVAFVLVIAIAMCMFPVAAIDQDATGIIVNSHDVQQNIQNDQQYNQQFNNQKAGADVTGNHDTTTVDNTVSTSVSTSTSTTTGSSSSVVINNAPAAYTYHDTLIGDTNSETISLYQNDALVVPMNSGEEMTRGQVENITWMSADPILVYAIDTNDADAIREHSAAPVYDDFTGIYDFGPVHVYRAIDYRHASRARQYLSTNNAIKFVAPEDGYYSFVLDTRPAFKRNGQEITGLLDSTCDISFVVYNDGFTGISNTDGLPKIGKIDVFPVDKKGHIITTN